MSQEESVSRPSELSRLQDIDERLDAARKKTWAAVEAIAQAVQPGMRESDGIKIAQQILVEMGSRKFWHKCHVRFGRGTVKNFDDPYDDNVLHDDDIFYIDIGPIWNGIEGDGGATFLAGSRTSVEMQRCLHDVRTVFDAVREHWQSSRATGVDLYLFAEARATALGWILAPTYVRGHRLAEFPHSFHSKLRVDELDFSPGSSRWVLEIHICDPSLRFGAFHEDLLTES